MHYRVLKSNHNLFEPVQEPQNSIQNQQNFKNMLKLLINF